MEYKYGLREAYSIGGVPKYGLAHIGEREFPYDATLYYTRRLDDDELRNYPKIEFLEEAEA